MKAALLLMPLLPLLSSALLMLWSRRITQRGVAAVACASVGAAALLVLYLGVELLMRAPGERQIAVEMGQWIAIGGLEVTAGLRIDSLSLVMAFVITFVGFFIHLYSSGYMAEEEGYARYFAWLNLFVAAMLVLVLADDLLLLYLGWEGVGLCSYLLIGFRYNHAPNGYAARKAFIITRLGDVLLLIALLYLASRFHTLRIDEVVAQAQAIWLPGASAATLVSLLILGGAMGKSAQVPLHTWLPDAMAGPTPVSALIHAATMVTAGVYLIARLQGLFALAPFTLHLVAVVGAVTLLVGATSALAQRDIKRVLAYSTISQIGYMFLALGLGAWGAAIFHLFTHAFFKALLFLAAGAVILAANHAQGIDDVGTVRRRLPLLFWTFVIGGASLAALPLVTAGFFSKELILSAAWHTPVLWWAAWSGALLTGVYVVRLIARLFFTTNTMEIHRAPGWAMRVPLIVLAIGAIVAGYVRVPDWIAAVAFAPRLEERTETPVWAAVLAAAAPFIGALLWWGGRRYSRSAAGVWVAHLLLDGWRFDALYARVVERSWQALARSSAGEVVEGINMGVAHLHGWAWRQLSSAQSGLVRHYAIGIAFGAVVLLWMAL